LSCTSSDWKISTVRWVAWLILCLGIAINIFMIRDAGIAVFSRVLAEQTIQQQDAGYSVDISQVDNYINFGQLMLALIVCIIAIALVVMLDYYLRAGQEKGRLIKRIGLVAVIELGIYGLSILIIKYV
jgi:hypothetical protein